MRDGRGEERSRTTTRIGGELWVGKVPGDHRLCEAAVLDPWCLISSPEGRSDGQKLFDAYPYGGLAEYLTAPQRNLVKLPDSVSSEEGARFGYLGTGYSALKKAGAGPGTTVLVDGISGTLGLGVALNALAMGATKIFGTGRNADLLDVRAIAPDRIEVLPVGEADLAEWVRAKNGGHGVDIAIDALGPGALA